MADEFEDKPEELDPEGEIEKQKENTDDFENTANIDGIVDIRMDNPCIASGIENFSKSLASLSGLMKDITLAASQLVNSEAMKTLQKSTGAIVEAMHFMNQIDFSSYFEPFRELSKKIAESIKNSHIPILTDEDKENLLQGYKSWGEYGWTVIPTSPFRFFEIAPNSIDEANKKAMSLCRKSDIDFLKKEILENKRVKKDFEEAVFCYDNKKYKSCSMILFSLIEGHLVRLQGPHKDGKNRNVGTRAVSKLKQKTDEEIASFYLMLNVQNLISCMEKMFERGKDFEKQPQVINRNFLDHGMLTRKVTKRDCIQLMLVYYNLLQLMQVIYND